MIGSAVLTVTLRSNDITRNDFSRVIPNQTQQDISVLMRKMFRSMDSNLVNISNAASIIQYSLSESGLSRINVSRDSDVTELHNVVLQ